MDDLDAAIEFEQTRVSNYDEVVALKGVGFDVQFADAVDDLEHFLGVARRTLERLIRHHVIII